MRGGGAAPKPPAGCKAPCTPGRVLRTRLQARHRNGIGKPPPPSLDGSAAEAHRISRQSTETWPLTHVGEARAVGSGQRASARRATGGARKPSRATSRLCGQIPRRPLPKTPPPTLSACAAKPPSIHTSKLPIAREARAVGSGQRASARRATDEARKPSRATSRLRGQIPRRQAGMGRGRGEKGRAVRPALFCAMRLAHASLRRSATPATPNASNAKAVGSGMTFPATELCCAIAMKAS